MATQNLVEQTIIFIPKDQNTGTPDSSIILANSLMQSFAANASGNYLRLSVGQYAHWNSPTWDYPSLLEITGYITPAFQLTVQQNIVNLQTAFPQFTITTWGKNVTFGF